MFLILFNKLIYSLRWIVFIMFVFYKIHSIYFFRFVKNLHYQFTILIINKCYVIVSVANLLHVENVYQFNFFNFSYGILVYM